MLAVLLAIRIDCLDQGTYYRLFLLIFDSCELISETRSNKINNLRLKKSIRPEKVVPK